MTKKTTRKAAEAAGTVVYCGPSIRGVARQYTAYNNGIPQGLKEAAEKNKILAALIVPLEELPAPREPRRQPWRRPPALWGNCWPVYAAGR